MHVFDQTNIAISLRVDEPAKNEKRFSKSAKEHEIIPLSLVYRQAVSESNLYHLDALALFTVHEKVHTHELQ